MTDPMPIPKALQHLIEKREAERRAQLDRRNPHSDGDSPESGERRGNDERRKDDRRD